MRRDDQVKTARSRRRLDSIAESNPRKIGTQISGSVSLRVEAPFDCAYKLNSQRLHHWTPPTVLSSQCSARIYTLASARRYYLKILWNRRFFFMKHFCAPTIVFLLGLFMLASAPRAAEGRGMENVELYGRCDPALGRAWPRDRSQSMPSHQLDCVP